MMRISLKRTKTKCLKVFLKMRSIKIKKINSYLPSLEEKQKSQDKDNNLLGMLSTPSKRMRLALPKKCLKKSKLSRINMNC